MRAQKKFWDAKKNFVVEIFVKKSLHFEGGGGWGSTPIGKKFTFLIFIFLHPSLSRINHDKEGL